MFLLLPSHLTLQPLPLILQSTSSTDCANKWMKPYWKFSAGFHLSRTWLSSFQALPMFPRWDLKRHLNYSLIPTPEQRTLCFLCASCLKCNKILIVLQFCKLDRPFFQFFHVLFGMLQLRLSVVAKESFLWLFLVSQ